MRDMSLAGLYALVVGVALIVVGLLGFVGNPLVGEPANGPLFVTGFIHDLVHLMTGALALYIAFGLANRQQALGVIALGIVYLLVVVLTFISGDLFGILDYPVNGLDQVLHLALGIAGVVVGWLSLQGRGLPSRT